VDDALKAIVADYALMIVSQRNQLQTQIEISKKTVASLDAKLVACRRYLVKPKLEEEYVC
jgi:hypothetical protein